MITQLIVRRARESDVSAIAALINEYARQATMLHKSPDAVALSLSDFIVATDARSRVLGCGAVKEYSPSLAEVASIAVDRQAQGRGMGSTLVEAVESLARRRGIREVFALTLTPGFFESLGYAVTDRARYPEKVSRDCLGCARRMACAEVCVWRQLSHTVELVAAA
jgi:amino-acid N-acetyltransferase